MYWIQIRKTGEIIKVMPDRSVEISFKKDSDKYVLEKMKIQGKMFEFDCDKYSMVVENKKEIIFDEAFFYQMDELSKVNNIK